MMNKLSSDGVTLDKGSVWDEVREYLDNLDLPSIISGTVKQTIKDMDLPGMVEKKIDELSSKFDKIVIKEAESSKTSPDSDPVVQRCQHCDSDEHITYRCKGPISKYSKHVFRIVSI